MVTKVAWAADGRLWYLATPEQTTISPDLWSVPAGGSRPPSKVLPGIVDFDVSPDGTQLAVVRDSHLLEIVRSDGTTIRTLGPARTVAWSADGGRLAVGVAGRVDVLNTDGSGLRTVNVPPSGQWDMRLSWRRSGSVVVIERRTSKDCDYCASAGFVVVDVADRAPREFVASTVGEHPALAP
jgi:hypothetical protein